MKRLHLFHFATDVTLIASDLISLNNPDNSKGRGKLKGS